MATALPTLDLRCLGPPAVLVEGRAPPPDVLWRKHTALLVYLALSPDHSRARNHLLGLLWAESPEGKARRSLNEAVRLLRAALGPERLLTQGDLLELNPVGLEVDALQFESLCGAGQLAALELLRGEFLEGFHLEDAPAFDAWMESERTRIRDAAIQLLIGRAEEQLAVTRYVEAQALARRALTLHPYSEPSISIGMRSSALDGDAAGALASYHAFAERLERELGERPSATLSGLAERIRAGKWQRPHGRHSSLEPPLTGRREVHAHLFGRLERLPRETSACLVIAGDPGSGRTRVLDTCAERLALAGAAVSTTRLLENDHDAPWSTLRALMRGGLLDAPGITATDHVGLRILAGLVPELRQRVEPLEALDVAQVSDALASLLRAAAEERPVALLVDDAQWADGATLAALHAVWSRKHEISLVLILTLELGVEVSTDLQALVGSVGREIPGELLRLEPLTQDDIAVLTETMAPWCTGKEERARLARRVAQETGGNPFLAVSLLRDLREHVLQLKDVQQWPPPGSTYDSSLPIALSAVIRNAIVARVTGLDEDSLAVLRTASVPGQVPDPPLIAEVSGLSLARVEAALDRLERERFVVFEGEHYRFNSRMLPAVIESECIQAGGRRRLRERYIAALIPYQDLDSQLLRAQLLAAERAPEAFEVARSVAERALALGAKRTASGAIRAAERVAGSDVERTTVLESLRQRASADRHPI